MESIRKAKAKMDLDDGGQLLYNGLSERKVPTLLV